MAAKKKATAKKKAEPKKYMVLSNGQQIEVEADSIDFYDDTVVFQTKGEFLRAFAAGGWTSIERIEEPDAA